jgi:hypothetical protein
MKNILTSLLILLAIATFAQKPLQLTVTVDGKPYQVKEGDTLRVDNKTIVVSTGKYSTFNYGALKFEYPKNYAFAEKKEMGIKTWTLTGNDFTVMYFEIAVEVTVDMFIDEFVKKFGKKNVKISDVSTSLGGMNLKGKHLKIEIAGQKMSMDIFQVPNNDDKVHLVAFQDLNDEDGSASDESVETLKVINASWKVKPGDD